MNNENREFVIKWTRTGLNGFYNYLVVAEDLDTAKKMWEEYAATDSQISYHWSIAKRCGHCGTVAWKEKGISTKEKGCYELDYERVFVGSDHLWD